MSFYRHKKGIDKILKKFTAKYHIELKSYANVGNHLHIHIRLFKRSTYTPFIRAVTAAIMMKITGFYRYNPKPKGYKFWDRRPFTRILQTFREFRNLVDYIQVNVFEGMGYTRINARSEVKRLRFEFQTQIE